MEKSAVIVILSTSLMMPTLAFAQEESWTDDAPAEGSATPAPTPPEQAAPDAASPEEPPTGAPQPDEKTFAQRFPWGFSGMGGPLTGGYTGGAGGVDARFGAQLSETPGIYGQPVLLLGAGAAASATGAVVPLVALGYEAF